MLTPANAREAALRYLEAGKQRRCVNKLIRHFGGRQVALHGHRRLENSEQCAIASKAREVASKRNLGTI
jgi:hypothetical protein